VTSTRAQHPPCSENLHGSPSLHQSYGGGWDPYASTPVSATVAINAFFIYNILFVIIIMERLGGLKIIMQSNILICIQSLHYNQHTVVAIE